jgi:Protein of unknown function (DUF5818)
MALAVGLVTWAPSVRAQSTSQSRAVSAQNAPAQQAQPAAERTFTGMIAKSGDKFVLKDMAAKAEYQLDDQDKAKDFAGKEVKVTGTLDAQTNTIHVADIQPAS